MSVLLVSRGTMSGGEAIGQCLTRHMGFRYLTREQLTAEINTHGELATQVLAGLPQAARHYARFSELRRPYKTLMRMALLEAARQGDLVYFGYSGHFLITGITHFVMVRLVAPLELRVSNTMSQRGLSADDAREYIRRVDAERTAWARFMYGKDLRDPRHYDLCINLRHSSITGACDFLVHAARQADFQPTPESIAAFDNLYLATHVETALITAPPTHTFEVGATARDGHVLLEGPYLEDAQRDAVIATAQAVDGVRSVEYQPGYAPDPDFTAAETEVRTPSA